MKKILDPLICVPGVRRAMLIAHDGVPILYANSHEARGDGEEGSAWHDSADDVNAFAGLVAGWLAEVQRTVDPMSWNAPTRLVLQAARGTLVLLVCERAMLSVELERGALPEELRLPMEAALARLQRTLRRDHRGAVDSEEIPGIHPGRTASAVDAEGPGAEAEVHPTSARSEHAPNHPTGNEVP
ncbi:MAG: roadblock/LC7 domain-containing protein [Planctomycetes bacterium]|nr:roadblock/LC7 domain-containing protein [Planctomycetota bacterium]